MAISVNTNRVSKYFDLPPLKQTERQEAYIKEDTLHENTVAMVNKTFIFGMEVEVENVPHPQVVATHQPYWNMTQDNSLRNNGVEFVSVPLKAFQLEYAIDQLQKSLPTDCDFSPRTSVHIHMNVRDLTMEQICNLVVVYTAVEDLLFRWVGNERDTNVFCIKLTETDYVQEYTNIVDDPRTAVGHWNKYTALNLYPMAIKGTVEFRHMAGTIDRHLLLKWVNLLSCLKTYAKDNTLNKTLQYIYTLNSNSEYETFLFDVFGELSRDLIWDDTDVLMADSISYIKLATIPMEPDTQQKSPERIEWDVPVLTANEQVFTAQYAQPVRTMNTITPEAAQRFREAIERITPTFGGDTTGAQQQIADAQHAANQQAIQRVDAAIAAQQVGRDILAAHTARTGNAPTRPTLGEYMRMNGTAAGRLNPTHPRNRTH